MLSDKFSYMKDHELNEHLASLIASDQVEDYCSNWNVTMPLAITFGAWVMPTAWERCSKKYCAQAIFIRDGAMARTTKYTSYSDDPLRATVKCLIKILEAGHFPAAKQ